MNQLRETSFNEAVGLEYAILKDSKLDYLGIDPVDLFLQIVDFAKLRLDFEDPLRISLE